MLNLNLSFLDLLKHIFFRFFALTFDEEAAIHLCAFPNDWNVQGTLFAHVARRLAEHVDYDIDKARVITYYGTGHFVRWLPIRSQVLAVINFNHFMIQVAREAANKE